MSTTLKRQQGNAADKPAVDQAPTPQAAHKREIQADLAIVGAGAAGLALAWAVLQKPELAHWRLVVVEKQQAIHYNRTWCFWSAAEAEHQEYLHHSWGAMEVGGPGWRKRKHLAPLRYLMVRNDTYERVQRQRLAASGRVEFVYEALESTQPGAREVQLETVGHCIRAQWVGSSVLPNTEQQRARAYQEQRAGFWLHQQFRGWELHTEQPVFQPDTVTLMDFRAPQQSAASFFYVLPYSSTHALVEYTLFTPQLVGGEYLDQQLREYLGDLLQGGAYRVEHEENGVIPMTDFQFSRQQHPRVVQLGASAGLTKPTTGYTFVWIQQDAQNWANYWAQQAVGRKQAAPPAIPHGGRFRFYDRLLLHICQHHPQRVAGIMQRLFMRNSFRRVLSFLDEQTPILQESWIFARLPWGPFLRAVRRLYL